MDRDGEREKKCSRPRSTRRGRKDWIAADVGIDDGGKLNGAASNIDDVGGRKGGGRGAGDGKRKRRKSQRVCGRNRSDSLEVTRHRCALARQYLPSLFTDPADPSSSLPLRLASRRSARECNRARAPWRIRYVPHPSSSPP